MKEKGLPHERLKLVAVVTMLIDHIGVVLVYAWYMQASTRAGMHMERLWNLYLWMRIIGRIAFPIYCFLLVEGACHTQNPKKYACRLAFAALISEMPYDLSLSGGIDWSSNNVMLTLLLGFLAVLAMNRLKGFWKFLPVIPAFLAAELLHTDYSGNGILLIAFFALTRNAPCEKLVRILAMPLVLWFGGTIMVGSLVIPIELFGMFSLIPIFCYSGRKRSKRKAVQWAFYLFYPVHLTVLWLLNVILFG